TSCHDQEQLWWQGRVLQGRDRHLYARLDRQDAGNAASSVDLLRRNRGRSYLRRRHVVVMREPRANRQPARSRLEFSGLVVVRSDEGAAQTSRRRLLLHARIELLLPVAAVQSETLDPD